jgi:hypothetical protein
MNQQQSTQLCDIPKDSVSNPDEARVLQDLINQNVDEMGGDGGQFEPGVDQAYAQEQEYLRQQAQTQAYQMQPPQMHAPPQLNDQMPMGVRGNLPPLQPGLSPGQSAPSNFAGPLRGPPPPNFGGSAGGYPQMAPHPYGGFGMPEDENWTDLIMNESKEPLIVAVVFTLLNFNIVQGLLEQYVPYMDNAYLQIFVKALVAGVLFYATKKLWKP